MDNRPSTAAFRDLLVWQRSKALAVNIYKITNQGVFSRDFGLHDQIRRCAVSVPSNIAEGDERGTSKEAIRFFYISKGSLAELITQLEIARDIGYLEDDVFHDLESECLRIGQMLGSLIKARSQSLLPQ